jgi:CRISPR-associated endonuclease/helicase Cas3
LPTRWRNTSHRKFTEHALRDDAGTEIVLLCGHRDFHDTLRFVCTKKQLPPAPDLVDITINGSDFSPHAPSKLFVIWERVARKCFQKAEVQRLIAVAKALLICADVAGSALPKEVLAREEKPEEPSWVPMVWLKEQFRDEDLRPHLEQVVQDRLKGQPMRPFQQQVAQSKAPVTLVTAGCGSGKTIAAIAWAAEQHPRRRLWLTYPTTGTATEGFRDYLDNSALNAKLIHGRAEVDLDIFGLRDGKEGDEYRRDQDRLAALREWGLDVITCTVDTVLGLIQNNRRGIYAWPNLASGAVVFDEIHSYDDALFGALLRFLEACPGIPALLMTASLPLHRRAALESLCKRVHGQLMASIEGPADLETLPRYSLHRLVSDSGETTEILKHAQRSNSKVLWVSNTVDRCLEAARGARQFGLVNVYHSRFRYEDRVRRHGDVINSFNPAKHPGFSLACTTQVAEMSLDLSADLLITDLAPIPAMIQRLGRLNRRSSPTSPAPVKPFVVLVPPRSAPYTDVQLKEARCWLDALGGRELSQRDLVDAWKHQEQPEAQPCESAWLDGLFSTNSRALRDASDGISVLLESDLPRLRRGEKKAIEVAIPMNRPPRGWEKWRRDRSTSFLTVPPSSAITYDEKEGAQWVK